MKGIRVVLIALVFVAIAVLAFAFWPSSNSRALRVGLSPYQDLAMIVNIKPLGLEKKYGTDVELITLPWEELLPSVATVGRGLDVGFASYAEYLTKYNNLNTGTSDPILFVYPLYVFKGGAFVTFKADIPTLSGSGLGDKELVQKVLQSKIGAQKKSIYEMMLFRLAVIGGEDPKKLQIIDTPLDQGFIAAEQGSLDAASAGLTQITEAQRRNGRVILTMDDLKFADFTGFIVKKSVYVAREKDIKNLINMWFESVDFVYRDLDKNSAASLAYLNSQASTRYTLDEYKRALSQEFLPRSVAEAEKQFVDDGGMFPVRTIRGTVLQYLTQEGVIKAAPAIPDFIKP